MAKTEIDFGFKLNQLKFPKLSHFSLKYDFLCQKRCKINDG